MTAALIIFAIIVAIALVYLASLDGDYLVRRSLRMSVDAQTVFDKVRDFTTWEAWSPWLMHEPETRLEFSENPDQEGGSYTWDGTRIGAGKLTHETLQPPSRIEERIEFVRPFKSVCKVWWEFEDKDGQTEVSWCMQGRMPFFLRFMTTMTKQMIEKDYDLGLAMLRGVLDPTAERPIIGFDGETELEAVTALTIPFAGGISDMVRAMEAGFPRLIAHVEQAASCSAGKPFTAYHKVNPKTMQFLCDMAVPVSEGTDAGEFETKRLGGGRFFKVSLKGSYDFLEPTWYSAIAHLRMYKLKMDKSRPSLEVYENDPGAIKDTNDLETTIYIPLR